MSTRRDSPALRNRDRRRSDETQRLLAAAKDAVDPRRRLLLDEVVLLNVGVAESLAARYQGRGVDPEDLRQVAYLGLVKAAQGFSTDRCTEFTSYAVPTIRGELKRHFRDTAWAVRPPRRIQELHAAIGITEPALAHRLHRSPTEDELATELGASSAEVRGAVAAADTSCFAPLSLDAPAGAESTGLSYDLLGETDQELERVEIALLLAPLLARLRPRERRILELRFVREWSQERIGGEIGVSQMQVSRLLQEVLGKLRDGLTDPAENTAGTSRVAA